MFLVLHACNALVYHILSGWYTLRVVLPSEGTVTGSVGVMVVGGWGLWGY